MQSSLQWFCKSLSCLLHYHSYLLSDVKFYSLILFPPKMLFYQISNPLLYTPSSNLLKFPLSVWLLWCPMEATICSVYLLICFSLPATLLSIVSYNYNFLSEWFENPFLLIMYHLDWSFLRPGLFAQWPYNTNSHNTVLFLDTTCLILLFSIEKWPL